MSFLSMDLIFLAGVFFRRAPRAERPSFRLAYFFGAGGLLPRPRPEGLPVLLGPFLR